MGNSGCFGFGYCTRRGGSSDLSQIAAIGSISVLLVHGVTHIGHLRKIGETGASRALVLLAAGTSLAAMLLAIVYVGRTSSAVLLMLAAFVSMAVVMEFVLQRFLGRTIQPRITTEPDENV